MTLSVDRIILAYDRAGSVRSFSEDGHLHVADSNISKAVINPYWGREVPRGEEMGLDPNKKYMLLRHPAELQKAAKSFNNLPILAEHVPVNAARHRADLVIGSTGTNARYVHPYLKNSLVFWTQPAIDAIQSGQQRELSCAYHYDPVMKSGVYNGQHFDGIMTNLRGNHVALVEDGRAGADVVVGDSAFVERSNAMARLSPAALVARSALWTYLTPRLAQDENIDFDALVRGVTSRNYNSRRREILYNVQRAANGRLAQDADVQDLQNLLQALGPEVKNADQVATLAPGAGPPVVAQKQPQPHHTTVNVPKQNNDQIENLGGHAVEPGGELPPELQQQQNDQLSSLGPLASPGATPGGPTGPGSIDQGAGAAELLQRIKQYLEQSGVSPEIINNLDALLNAGGDEDPDNDRPDWLQEDEDPGANYAPPGIDDPTGTAIDPTPIGEGTLPKGQEEADDPNFVTGDRAMRGYVTRDAMDRAIRLAQDRAITNQRRIREAERYVRAWVGDIAQDSNSAADVYRTALRALGVRGVEKMHPDALRPVLDAQPRPNSRIVRERQAFIASDSAVRVEGSFAERFPDAAKIILQ